MLFLFVSRGIPQIDQFVQWAKAEMPSMTWTPDGLVMNIQNPYTMVHPKLGPLVTFDANQVDVTTETIGEVVMFVTPGKLFVKRGIREVRVYDLTRQVAAAPDPNALMAVNITSESVQKFYDSLKPWLIFFVVLFFFPFFFLWKLIAALIYSWIGLLINFTRTPKLPYNAILNVSLFALTAATLIQWLRLMVPALNRIPFGLVGSLLITCIYLFLAVKKTEETLPPTPSIEEPSAES